jgi:hypothetical protein
VSSGGSEEEGPLAAITSYFRTVMPHRDLWPSISIAPPPRIAMDSARLRLQTLRVIRMFSPINLAL